LSPEGGRKPVNQVVPVLIILEDLPSFDPTNQHVVQHTGCIETGLPWHEG
jgi:hypothetical protein